MFCHYSYDRGENSSSTKKEIYPYVWLRKPRTGNPTTQFLTASDAPEPSFCLAEPRSLVSDLSFTIFQNEPKPSFQKSFKPKKISDKFCTF